jgi:oligopeptide/dipeptide ABC transporter ATP-binding protein
VVSELCERVLVMYGGTIVEQLPAHALHDAHHPYTRALLAASPPLEDRGPLQAIPGTPPDPTAYPAGCPFAPRCVHAVERCHGERPVLLPVPGSDGDRTVACFVVTDAPSHAMALEA